jgi:galactosyl transferase GMA12/MNN10 family
MTSNGIIQRLPPPVATTFVGFRNGTGKKSCPNPISHHPCNPLTDELDPTVHRHKRRLLYSIVQSVCSSTNTCWVGGGGRGRVVSVSASSFIISVRYCICIVCAIPLVIYMVQRILSRHVQHQEWVPAPITYLERTCPRPHYETVADTSSTDTDATLFARNRTAVAAAPPPPGAVTRTDPVQRPPKICLTTLTDESNKSFWNRLVGWRNFDGLLQLTWDNKYQYAQRHGYYMYDESAVVNHTRPPSWFKIMAVRRLLLQEQCDWVFWMDADICIMNSTIRIEDFLPSDSQYDLLLSMDTRGSKSSSSSSSTNSDSNSNPSSRVGYNAGAWVIRNSPWSIQFLNSWWDMKSYIQPIGQAISGDNDAFKDLLRTIPDFHDHCLAPPRCTFNSFAKFIKPDQLASVTETITAQTYYMSEASYHKGDFVAHVAGLSNKKDTIQSLLDLAQ